MPSIVLHEKYKAIADALNSTDPDYPFLRCPVCGAWKRKH